MLYSKEILDTFKRQYSSRSLTRNLDNQNLTSDIRDTTISKNGQSHPNLHVSIFEDEIFQNTIFKNHFFPKFSKQNLIFFKKFFLKKFLEKKFRKNFVKKIYVRKKVFYFQRFLEIVFWKIKSSKIDRWQLGFDYFLTNFKGL